MEFKNEPINSIMELIEGEPEVASVPIYSGKTNLARKVGYEKAYDLLEVKEEEYEAAKVLLVGKMEI